jgi:lipopolysaccharide/colanic/teichoic acid biosynthesis glycosyltransferase
MRGNDSQLEGEAWLVSRQKRRNDIMIASILAAPALGVTALSAAILAAESRCNPFFRQERMGQEGRAFGLLKLRTLGPENYHDIGNGAEDARATKFGRMLRKLALDESPQLLHVVHGQMSIIGPRPLIHEEFERMRKVLPHYEYSDWERAYLRSRPGLVSSFSNESRNYMPLSDEYCRTRAELDTEDYLTASATHDFQILRASLKVGFDYARKHVA